MAGDSFAEFLCEQLAPPGPVTVRRMFGRTGVFCDGVMLGLVSDAALYFRVDDASRALFQKTEGLPPFGYERRGRRIDLPFRRAPDRLFDEPEELVIWARAALAAGRRVAARGARHGKGEARRGEG